MAPATAPGAGLWSRSPADGPGRDARSVGLRSPAEVRDLLWGMLAALEDEEDAAPNPIYRLALVNVGGAIEDALATLR